MAAEFMSLSATLRVQQAVIPPLGQLHKIKDAAWPLSSPFVAKRSESVKEGLRALDNMHCGHLLLHDGGRGHIIHLSNLFL